MQCNAKPLGSTMSLVYDYILHSTTSYNKFTTSYNKYMYIVYNMETMPSYIQYPQFNFGQGSPIS